MNKLKFFVLAILFARQRKIYMGSRNSGLEPLVYLAVTVPPQNFSPAYATTRSATAAAALIGRRRNGRLDFARVKTQSACT